MKRNIPSTKGGDKFGRKLKGKSRGKLRELSLDYLVIFLRQVTLAIQSCSTSLEILHPAQTPDQLQKN